MGFVQFDTSDNLMLEQTRNWLFSRTCSLQQRLRPADFSVSYYIREAREVPKAETPHYIITTTIIVDGHSTTEDLAFYTRPRFEIALRHLVDIALKR